MKSIEILGNHSKSLGIIENYLGINENRWESLETAENCWDSLEIRTEPGKNRACQKLFRSKKVLSHNSAELLDPHNAIRVLV